MPPLFPSRSAAFGSRGDLILRRNAVMGRVNCSNRHLERERIRKMNKQYEQQVRERAYAIWEQEGRSGDPREH